MADSDRALSFSVSTYIIGEATVVQDTDFNGTFTRKVVDVATRQLDAKVRSALILLGWKPPSTETGDEDDCRCHACGHRYIGDLLIHDEVWEQIKPEGATPGAGLLCPSCIMHRIVGRGIWTAAHAFNVDDIPLRLFEPLPLP